MLQRDSQTLTISRQGLLLVTAMGVGLLTLVYVLGVQVGKQSASMSRANSQASGEDLTKLPAPLSEQLKPFEANAPADKSDAKPELPTDKPDTPEPQSVESPKDEPKKEDSKSKKEEARPSAPGKWTLQLVSTTDPAEAARVVAKAKAAGYATTIVKDKKVHKVRLVKTTSKDTADSTAAALKAKGFRPFAVKAD